MSLEERAAERLQAILDEHGVLAVLRYCHENAADVLGAADTALNRGALMAACTLIQEHGKPTLPAALLRVLVDGVALALAKVVQGTVTTEPTRVRLMQLLDEVGWRLERAAEVARHG